MNVTEVNEYAMVNVLDDVDSPLLPFEIVDLLWVSECPRNTAHYEYDESGDHYGYPLSFVVEP